MNRNKAANERIRRRNRRITAIGCFFTFFYALVALKAFYLQAVKDESLSEKAYFQCRKSVKTEGRRGAIFDANGRELVLSIRTEAVGAHPGKVENVHKASRLISDHLDVDARKVERLLASDSKFVWLDRKASPSRAGELKKLGIDWLEYIPGYCRVYPNRSLAAQLLGFSGVDGNGLEGLEYYYEDYLDGSQRSCTIFKDAIGRIFQREARADSGWQGRNLVLTIDSNIQCMAEEALEAAVKKYSAKSGMAVVMAPRTGAIRAIAHYPSFDPNRFSEYPRNIWRNRAVTDPFEPGSAMKVFTAAAALESGTLGPGSLINCENGRYRTGGHVINDTHPHENLTLAEVVKFSSNIGAAKVVEKIGAETLYKTLRDFGFGRKTGIDCPGETAGRLRHYSRWRTIDQANIAFGQGVSVSAVQLVSAVSAVANKGILMKPRIVKAVKDQDGRVVERRKPEVRGRAVSEETAEQIKAIMYSVTSEEGTGSRAVPAGYTVCGKTGTAQKLNDNGTYENCEYKSIFLGFAPRNSPELAVLVVIDEPQDRHYGGIVAAPAFRRIVREAFNYMEIPPDRKGNQYQLASHKRE